MVALAKVWSDDLNNEFSDQEDQQVQYRESCFYLKETLRLAGWTVVRSTDGTNAPDATDQWTSAAILLFGTGGSPRAWIVMQSPANWVVGAGLFNYILIGLNNATPSATPRAITLQGSVLTFTGGSISSYPTSAGSTWTHTSVNILAYTGAVRARWNAWWTADGDIYFAIKGDGVSCVSTFLSFRSSGVLAATDGGVGTYRAVYLFLTASSVTTDVVNWSNLQTGNSFRSFMQNGITPTSNSINWLSPLSYFTAWPRGQSDGGTIPDAPIDVGANNATTGENRYFGQQVDVRGAPTNAPFNELIDGDTDPVQLVCIGDIWMPSSARLL